MKKYIVLVWVVTILVLVLTLGSSCAVPPPAGKIDASGETYGITRFIDSEAGVVCWKFYIGGSGSGLSCLPIKDTNLKVK